MTSLEFGEHITHEPGAVACEAERLVLGKSVSAKVLDDGGRRIRRFFLIPHAGVEDLVQLLHGLLHSLA